MKLVCFATLPASAGVAGEPAIWKGGEGTWSDVSKGGGELVNTDAHSLGSGGHTRLEVYLNSFIHADPPS